jgi:hypothetical protein
MIIFKQDRRKFWKNFMINLMKTNPARTIFIPLSIILFTFSFTIDNNIEFREIYKKFKSKEGIHYYVLYDETVESPKELEVFEDDKGYYIKRIEVGPGKSITIFLTSVFLIMIIVSIFIEDIEIKKVVKKTILNDLSLITIKSNNYSEKYIWTSYSKKVLESIRIKNKDEVYGLDMTLSEFMQLENHIEREDLRDKKLEEIGILD